MDVQIDEHTSNTGVLPHLCLGGGVICIGMVYLCDIYVIDCRAEQLE